MEHDKIQELVEERVGLVTEMRTLNDLSDAEKRDFTSEEEQEYDRLEARVSTLKKQIDRETDLRATEREQAESAADFDPRQTTGAPIDEAGALAERTAEYSAAFSSYLRGGIDDITREQRQLLRQGWVEARADQAKGTTTLGGFLVPELFERKLVEALVAAGIVRQLPITQITTSAGEDMLIPKVTGRGAANWVTEAAAVPVTSDDFGQATLKAHKAARLVKASIELVEDSAFDIEGFLAKSIGLSIGVLENDAYLTGNGTDKPTGMVVGSALGVTTASMTAVTSDELIDMQHALAQPYRRTARWLFDDSAVKAVRKLKDGNLAYIFQPALSQSEPDTLLGKPFFTDAGLADFGTTGNKFGLYGDFSSYWIRDVGRPGPATAESVQSAGSFAVRRLNERFADNLQVGYIAYHRTDGIMIGDANALRHIKHA